MQKTYQPNRPIRVGTELLMTDAQGRVPKAKAAAVLAEATMAQTKDELVSIAQAEGVEIEIDDNKADLVAKVTKARKAK